MALVVVVNGPPASGKTYLARYLRAELGLPLFSKDGIKESFGDVMDVPDVETSMCLGRGSFNAFASIVAELLAHQVSFIAENAFRFNSDLSSSRDSGADFLQVLCHAETEILLERYRRRSFSGTRHRLHKDEFRVPEFEALIRTNDWGFLDLPGDRISIDTTYFDSGRYQEGVNLISDKARALI